MWIRNNFQSLANVGNQVSYYNLLWVTSDTIKEYDLRDQIARIPISAPPLSSLQHAGDSTYYGV